METKEWTFMDKKEWGNGPWQNEPDKVQFSDPATGLPCLIHRNDSGNLCGYVGVSAGHPLFGIDYSSCTLPTAQPRGRRSGDDDTPMGMKMPEWMLKHNEERLVCTENYCSHTPESILEVHGGITFANFCRETKENGRGICHVVAPGEPEKVWWFGFDCGHLGDQSPAYMKDGPRLFRDGTYKTIAYVKDSIAGLAAQLHNIGKEAKLAAH